MFGQNKVEGRKFFVEERNRLLVTSIFTTLQGEGPFQGRPAIFVRLAKCNLQCWFCDTYFDTGDWRDIEELAGDLYIQARALFVSPRSKLGLVITGGEPSLQMNVTPFLHNIEAMRVFAFTQIESNGIQSLPALPPRTVLVVSPKATDTRGLSHYAKPHKDVLERADCMKFVLDANEDTIYHDVPEWALTWREETGKPIYVSPMNIYKKLPDRAAAMIGGEGTATLESRSDAEVISFWEPELLHMRANQENHEYAARYALKKGLFLTLQQHLYASLA